MSVQRFYVEKNSRHLQLPILKIHSSSLLFIILLKIPFVSISNVQNGDVLNFYSLVCAFMCFPFPLWAWITFINREHKLSFNKSLYNLAIWTISRKKVSIMEVNVYKENGFSCFYLTEFHSRQICGSTTVKWSEKVQLSTNLTYFYFHM